MKHNVVGSHLEWDQLMIRCVTVTCAQKLTDSQRNLVHGAGKQRSDEKTKTKELHVVDGVKPVQVWENLVALPQESERI